MSKEYNLEELGKQTELVEFFKDGEVLILKSRLVKQKILETKFGAKEFVELDSEPKRLISKPKAYALAFFLRTVDQKKKLPLKLTSIYNYKDRVHEWKEV